MLSDMNFLSLPSAHPGAGPPLRANESQALHCASDKNQRVGPRTEDIVRVWGRRAHLGVCRLSRELSPRQNGRIFSSTRSYVVLGAECRVSIAAFTLAETASVSCTVNPAVEIGSPTRISSGWPWVGW